MRTAITILAGTATAWLRDSGGDADLVSKILLFVLFFLLVMFAAMEDILALANQGERYNAGGRRRP